MARQQRLADAQKEREKRVIMANTRRKMIGKGWDMDQMDRYDKHADYIFEHKLDPIEYLEQVKESDEAAKIDEENSRLEREMALS